MKSPRSATLGWRCRLCIPSHASVPALQHPRFRRYQIRACSIKFASPTTALRRLHHDAHQAHPYRGRSGCGIVRGGRQRRVSRQVARRHRQRVRHGQRQRGHTSRPDGRQLLVRQRRRPGQVRRPGVRCVDVRRGVEPVDTWCHGFCCLAW